MTLKHTLAVGATTADHAADPEMSFFVTSVGSGDDANQGGLVGRMPIAKSWLIPLVSVARPAAPICQHRQMENAVFPPGRASGLALGIMPKES